MFPLGFVVGAVAGVATMLVIGPQVAQHARPVAKAMLKAALRMMHEAQVESAQIAEAAEDLYAEAKAEVTTEVFAAAMAAAQAKAAAQAAQAKGQEPPANGSRPAAAKVARRRTAVKRSRVAPSADG
jgi:hypothetical protein